MVITLTWDKLQVDQYVFKHPSCKLRELKTFPAIFIIKKHLSYSEKLAGWFYVILFWQVSYEFLVETQHAADRVYQQEHV